MEHPEIKDDEVFVGNTNEIKNLNGINYRISKPAYYIDGTKMDDSGGYSALFIKRTSLELYNNRKEQELKRIKEDNIR